MLRLSKYHALGNDYLVLDPRDLATAPEAPAIRRLCHRNLGAGSDGILYGPLPSKRADFGLRIFNPDGSEAEKSGNGLRIFARYLYDHKRVGEQPFQVETPGGIVRCAVSQNGDLIEVEMGRVSFQARDIPVQGEDREVLNEPILINGQTWHYYAATIGNPHCVVPVPVATAALVRQLGPHLEHDPRFPRRTNVQLLQVLDRHNIRIEIWERGAGYTLASGSSSSAAGAVARKMGLVDSPLTVHMPGGQLQLQISDAFDIIMTGPATRVAELQVYPEVLTQDLPEHAE